jgi:hypothetical protein
MPTDPRRLELRVRQDGIMVVHRHGEPTLQTFRTMSDVLTFLRDGSAVRDSRLVIYGFDGRKLMDTTI